MSPVVIDLDELRTEASGFGPCECCPSRLAVVVERGVWEISLLHHLDCPRVGPQPPDSRPRLALVRTGGVAS